MASELERAAAPPRLAPALRASRFVLCVECVALCARVESFALAFADTPGIGPGARSRSPDAGAGRRNPVAGRRSRSPEPDAGAGRRSRTPPEPVAGTGCR